MGGSLANTDGQEDTSSILKDIRDLSASQLELEKDKNQSKADNRISASEKATSTSKPRVVTSVPKPPVPQVVASDPPNSSQRDQKNSDSSQVLMETLPALVDAIQYNTESIISAMKKGRKRSLIKMVFHHAARLMTINTLIDSIQYNTTAVVEALEKGNSIRLSQFKAENRISASEEAMSASSSTPGKSDAGGVKRKSMISGLKGIKDDIFSGGGGGLKGIIGNILSKFGVAGKFLLGLGTTFLLPLITNPAGWAVLAGLAVGGLVFAYWDDIVSFVGKMFDGVKSMFSKVISKISSMLSSIGDTIKEILEFFNPIALAKTLAKAILPAKYYDAVASFFGSEDTNQEKSTPKPYKRGANDVVLDDMPEPVIKSRGSWGKKSSDKTKKGILGIMNSKKQLIGANDIEPQDSNPITSTQQTKSLPQLTANKDNVLRKDKLIAETIEKGMDNKIDNRSTQNNKPPANQNIISSPVVNNNNTTIKQEKSYDTDITARGLNKSSTGFWDDF